MTIVGCSAYCQRIGDISCSQAAVLAQPLSASLAAALPHWAEQQPLQEPVALAAAAGGAPSMPAFLQRRGAGVLYGCAKPCRSISQAMAHLAVVWSA